MLLCWILGTVWIIAWHRRLCCELLHKCHCTSQQNSLQRLWLVHLVAIVFPASTAVLIRGIVTCSFPSKHTNLFGCCSQSWLASCCFSWVTRLLQSHSLLCLWARESRLLHIQRVGCLSTSSLVANAVRLPKPEMYGEAALHANT